MPENKKEEKFVLGEVATQTAPVIIDTTKKPEEENRTLTTEEALIRVLNNQEKLMKLLD